MCFFVTDVETDNLVFKKRYVFGTSTNTTEDAHSNTVFLEGYLKHLKFCEKKKTQKNKANIQP